LIEPLHLKNGRDLRSRLFLSHASEDREIASEISATFRDKQIAVWLDSERLTPGTPDWERTIREGIAQSLAVIVLASPHAQASPYVRAELTIAKSQGIPIIPAWVSGERWSDCIAMDLIYTQYIDLRGEMQNVGIGRLLEEVITITRRLLSDHIVMEEADVAIATRKPRYDEITHERSPAPPGFMTVYFEEMKPPVVPNRASVPGAFIRIAKYEVIGQLLNDIYQQYLADRFDPLTYGSKWILQGGQPQWIVLGPWALLSETTNNYEAFRDWGMNMAINNCSLIERSPWTVVAPILGDAYGIGGTDAELISVMVNEPKMFVIALREGIFRRADPSELGNPGLTYAIVGRRFLVPKERAFIQVESEKSKVEQFRRYWRRA